MLIKFQHGIAQKGQWQVTAFQGYTYTQRGEAAVVYLPNVNLIVHSVHMPNYSLGISSKKPLGKRLALEYGLQWQLYQFKNVYDGIQIGSHTEKFNFLKINTVLRKDFYCGHGFFITTGINLSVLAAFSKTFEDNFVNQYGLIQNREGTANDQPTFNVGYAGFLGVGKKLYGGKQEIAIRATLEQLLNSYNLYDTQLNAKGVSVVYTFGNTLKKN